MCPLLLLPPHWRQPLGPKPDNLCPLWSVRYYISKLSCLARQEIGPIAPAQRTASHRIAPRLPLPLLLRHCPVASLTLSILPHTSQPPTTHRQPTTTRLVAISQHEHHRAFVALRRVSERSTSSDTLSPMFSRFWSSDSRGGKPTEPDQLQSGLACYSQHIQHDKAGVEQPLDLKRRRADSLEDGTVAAEALRKRQKLDDRIQEQLDNAGSVMDSLESAEDKIESAFQLQILIKHEEKRLIDTRLAECQAALEQLRRVHLKPYPVNCPTPQQMLDISAGKGHALQRPNEAVPPYAPPYGVVDGPYARHYDRWLIPHRDFDGGQDDVHSDFSRSRASFAEGRTTRNSFGEPSSAFPRGRPSRSAPSAKLQALTSAQPAQRKANAGPCVLKRSDGQVVKLVCIDCQRENFSSTQGFINHCRIAHKRDFKSHEEAAVKCGQPYKPVEAESTPAEDRASAAASASSAPSAPAPAPVPAPAPQVTRQPGVVNPLARDGNDITYKEACASLSARLKEAIKLHSQVALPGAGAPKSAHGASADKPAAKVNGPDASKARPAPETPYLSRLVQSKKFSGDLRALVSDAKIKVSLDDIAPDDESDDGDTATPNSVADTMPARVPVVKRVPAGSAKSPAPAGHSGSSKALAHGIKADHPPTDSAVNSHGSSDEDVEMEEPSLSPSTLTANNAPSLVSDDGEYDESDEGSSVSGHSEGLDAHSVSDVAEMTMDEDHVHRGLRRASTSVSSAVRLRRDDPKHVGFVSPVSSSRNEKRKRQA